MNHLRPAIIVVFALFTSSLFAQKNPVLINSGQLITDGFKLHKDGKYEEAAATYDLVDRNDTNYISAQYEEAYSLYMLGKYDTAIRICRALLKEDYASDFNTYNLLGNALDEKKLNNEAIAAYKEALAKFPMAYLLYFNLGVTNYRAHHTDTAYFYIKKALEMNPFHGASHYFLGLINAEMKRWTPAMLAFHTAIILQPNEATENKALNFMIKIAQGDYETDSIPHHLSEPEDPAFVKIDKLIESKVAFREEYKIASKLEEKMMKQTQLIMETMQQSKPKSDNYFVKMYVPLFMGIMDDGHLKTLLYYPYHSLDNEIINKWRSKSKKDIESFEAYCGKYFAAQAEYYMDEIDGKPFKFKRYNYRNHNIQVLGDFADAKQEVPKGYWKIYYENTKLGTEGRYNDNGKKTGIWKSYYDDGSKKATTNYKEGKVDGAYKEYHQNGNVATEAVYKDGLYDGMVKEYYKNGALKSEEAYKAGKQDGPATYYHQNGNKKIDAPVKENNIDGKVIEYDAAGYKTTETEWKGGKKDGSYTEYFSTGKVRIKGAFKTNLAEGKFEYYNYNGKLVKEGEFADGKMTGTWKEYFDNGKLSQEGIYKNGKLAGLETHYDDDGVKFIEASFKDDKLNAYKFYDKTGKVISESKEAHGQIDLKSYSPDGKLEMEGKMVKGQRVGLWNFYYESGGLRTTETYEDGEVNGPVKTYHKNGAVKMEGKMKHGEWDGKYKKFYQNGQLQEEGNCVNGKSEGDTYFYFSNGAMSSHSYYISGDERGWQAEYYPDGKLDDEYYMGSSHMTKYLVYDTTGKVVSSYLCPNGTATMDMKNLNGKPLSKAQYKNGRVDGTYQRYFSNGQLQSEPHYVRGIESGTFKSYHENGKVHSVGHFTYGKKDSIWTYYDDNGLLNCKGPMRNDENEGYWTWYHENGKPEMIAKYKGDEKDSIVTYYAPDGSLRMKLRYKDGNILGFTYPGKDGKDMPEIPLPDETGKVVAYYANGNKSFEASYKKGQRDGKWTAYYTDGKPQYVENYKEGWREGKETTYYPDGKVETEQEYMNDNYHGPRKMYDKNGAIKNERNYYMGRLHGVGKDYEAGKVTKQYTFYYGVLLTEK